jgi:hypothetical protein
MGGDAFKTHSPTPLILVFTNVYYIQHGVFIIFQVPHMNIKILDNLR